METLPSDLVLYIVRMAAMGGALLPVGPLRLVCRAWRGVMDSDRVMGAVAAELGIVERSGNESWMSTIGRGLREALLLPDQQPLMPCDKQSKKVMVFVGAVGVGKSCIVVRFIANMFMDEYDPTIEDYFRKSVHFGDDHFPCYLFDTAVNTLGTDFRGPLARWADAFAFIIVYSVVDRHSFLEARRIKQQVDGLLEGLAVPIVLVGNKIDLKDHREVSFAEGLAMARAMGPYCRFIEASAKTPENIDAILTGALSLRLMKREAPPSKSRCVIA